MSRPKWAHVRLAECIATINSGVSVNSDDRPRGPGEIGVLKTSAVSAGSFKADENKVVIKRERSRATESVLGGSILFSRMNTPQLVGESCYVEADDPSLFLPDRLWQIRVDSSRIDARWLSFVLLAPRVASEIKGLATGTSGSMKNIARSSLLGIDILLPPIREQRRIAETLVALDDQIQLASKVIAKLEQAGRGLMEDLLSRGVDITGRLRPAESFETQTRDDKSFPASWIIVRLDQIAEVERGKFGHRPRNDPMYLNGPFPFIQTGDIAAVEGGVILDASQSLSHLGAAVSRKFAAGTIAVTIAANIADTAMLGRPMYFPDSVVGVSVYEPHRAEYVQLVLRAAKPRLESRAPQSAQRNINLQDLRPLDVPLPDPAEQRRICQVMKAHANAVAVERDALEKLLKKKAALLDDLLSGRVRVPQEAMS
ncbi:restriction endonuclease subunit S [Actinacidiphila oryziradicis]|uniref:Type I restriction modification DNA specificity domain-containing protein n=1 Tax=Actinacidiphila oryziradicis TaxID=2571141 RepID=A0A4U0T8X6_9ACTN|nr:restriction endonuclease subunit S [Actinacidiphila oryziradicis]TKA12085.1 hypothetical protein FCI23_07200 [Actinacidiphila oryziradicis]